MEADSQRDQVGSRPGVDIAKSNGARGRELAHALLGGGLRCRRDETINQ